MAVVRLMISFWKGLPNSLEPTLNSSEEFETYSKAILYRRIVFTIACYFVLSSSTYWYCVSNLHIQIENTKILTVFCTLTVFRTLTEFRIFPEDFTSSFKQNRRTEQIGAKFVNMSLL